MRASGLSVVAAAGFLIYGIGGCQMPSTRVAGVDTQAVRDPMIADIPKPGGFQLVDDRSVFWQSGRLRGGKCEYVGPASVLTVKKFYREYMPQAGFEEREWSLTDGLFRLRFESQDEVCNVSIRRRGRSTAVTVEIAPQAAGSTERPVQPLSRP